MPVILKIDSRRRVVYSTFYGKVTDQELIRHGSSIASDPDFKRDFSEIVDFSAVSDMMISESTLRTMAGTQSLFSDKVLHIVVAPSEPAFQLANRYKQLARESRPKLFVVRTPAEAYKLLDSAPLD